jgi:hypothetical protein
MTMVAPGNPYDSLPYEQQPKLLNRSPKDELAANAIATARHNNGIVGPKKLVKEKEKGLLSKLNPVSLTKGKGDSRESLKNKISAPQPYDPSQMKIDSPVSPVSAGPPIDDTPISAVNVSERRVTVTCNELSIKLPVTTTTTAREILYSAANCLGQNIVPEESVLTEYFNFPVLVRPLRSYEHVRDVMNSWVSDEQNHLIVTGRSDDNDEEGEELLDAKFVPRKQPSVGVEVELYHSPKAGKWEKRWITLKPDGQVTMSKKAGGDSTNICHMRDCDIYWPTRREFKTLKVPKKFCYAIKSQLKSSMFLTSENFVHYFSADKKEVARNWYTAVQQWRSWYLINILGEGTNNREVAEASGAHNLCGKGIHNKMTAGAPDQRPFSTESTPYQLGSFRPLLDLESWDTENTERASQKDYSPTVNPDQRAHVPSLRHQPSQHHGSRASTPPDRPFSSDAVRGNGAHPKKHAQPTAPKNEGTFGPTTLLGQTYAQRQQAMRDREFIEQLQGPFIEGGLLRGQELQGNKNRSRKGTATSAGSFERDARPLGPKPLVDLTPSYDERPRRPSKGRGVVVEPGTPLIEVATGPLPPPGTIASTRRKLGQRSATVSHEQRPVTAGGPVARYRAGTMRSMRSNGQQPQLMPSSSHLYHGRSSLDTYSTPSGQSAESPFAPTGLIARSGATQGAAMTGRGVATGNRNMIGRPLIDISEKSKFPEGSLLRSAEQAEANRYRNY